MASSTCALISSITIPTSRVYATPYASPCSSLLFIRNGKTIVSVASLSCTVREWPKLARLNQVVSKSKETFCHATRCVEKTRNIQWFVAQAVSTGTADSAQAEASEESASQLVDKLLSLVKDTDRGALLKPDAQANVADVACQLEKMGIPEPLKSPLIYGDWNVAYSSNPTSPGGGYRTWLGRLIFRTRDMIQSIVEPDGVVNVVRFALLGLLGGEVTLKGKLIPLDSKMIQVDFQPPDLQIGPFKFSYGGMSTVKISVTYLDKDVRLGRGSRGTIFVFTRR